MIIRQSGNSFVLRTHLSISTSTRPATIRGHLDDVKPSRTTPDGSLTPFSVYKRGLTGLSPCRQPLYLSLCLCATPTLGGHSPFVSTSPSFLSQSHIKMAPVTFKTVYLSLALIALPQVLAGPACASRHYGQPDCIKKCGSHWGYGGHYMGGFARSTCRGDC
jgi:hypothetical protein